MHTRTTPKIPRWSEFRRLGNSGILRSSYLWVIAVPAVSKLLAVLDSGSALPSWFTLAGLHLGLPFSLKMFYYSSFAFACASLMYSLACPRIVRNYERFSEWDEEGRGGRQIVREFLFLIFRPRVSGWEQESALRHFAGTLRTTVPQTLTYPEGTTMDVDYERVFEIAIEPSREADAFWYVRDFADSLRPSARIICALCYLVGFVLLAALVIHNFRYVWRFTF